MAYVNSSTVTLADRFVAFRTQLAAKMAARKLYRTTMTELSSLSDRELADLGIHRSMIKQIAMDATAK